MGTHVRGSQCKSVEPASGGAGSGLGTRAVALEHHEFFSLLALRARTIRLWLTGIGLAAFGAAYVGPIALAVRTPEVSRARVVQLPALSLPSFALPTLAVPKLHT